MNLKSLNIVAIALLIGLSFSNKSFAQSGSSSIADDSLRDAYIVGGCGLAGAILGLSTLSFVEEPKEHTRNILMGAAVGIVAGVAVVAYFQANNSKTIMGESSITPVDAEAFSSIERIAAAEEMRSERAVAQIDDPFQFSVNFSF